MDEVAEASEDWVFVENIVKKHILFPDADHSKINSEELVNWINTQYEEHVLYGRERFRFIRNWNYYLPQHYTFVAWDPWYYSTVTLVSTIPGIPKVSDFELFGDYWFTSNPPEERRAYWKKVLGIRNNSSALKYGTIENVWKSGDDTYAYLREYEDEKAIVVINFLDKKATSYLDLSFLPEGTVLYDELNDKRFVVDTPENFKISVPKYGSRILVL
jgi:hypothetical protein